LNDEVKAEAFVPDERIIFYLSSLVDGSKTDLKFEDVEREF